MSKFSVLVMTGAMIFLSIGLTACGGGSSINSDLNQPVVGEPESGRLIRINLIAEYSKDAIQIPQFDTNYSVKVYKVVYETKNIDGSFVNASGLLTIPQKLSTAKSPTLIYHHGTIYDNRFAPTEDTFINAPPILPAYMGFISIAPDYIGYGESKSQMHPYLNADVTAMTTINMLRASQTFLKDNNILNNGQVFLGGYSQGGSATLSTQRKIESDFSDEFNITASSAGAGSYTFSNELLEQTQAILDDFDNFTIVRPSNVGLIMKSMDDGYDLNIINKLFKPQYASVVDSIYDGSHDSDYIDSQLTMQASQLFNKDFLQRVVDGNEPSLVNAFKANDLYDWSPKAPTILYHGREDDWVSFSNAQLAYDTMLARGVTNLELVECEIELNQVTNHANCFVPYLFSSYAFFLQFATDL